MATTLLRETLELDALTVYLDPDSVTIATVGEDGKDGDSMTFRPTTRQEANRLSIGLKKAARRLENVGHNLPDEPAR